MDEPAPQSRRGLSPGALILRVVLIAVLVLMVIGWFFDRQARTSAEAAHAKLDEALKREDTLDPIHTMEDEPLTPAEVEKLIGKPPDGPGEVMGDELHTSYSWRGVFYSYTVYAVYQGGRPQAGTDDAWKEVQVLSQVSLNEPPQ